MSGEEPSVPGLEGLLEERVAEVMNMLGALDGVCYREARIAEAFRADWDESGGTEGTCPG